MRFLLFPVLLSCGVGGTDYEPPLASAPPTHQILPVVTVSDGVAPTLQEVVDGINSACGEPVLQRFNEIPVPDTIIVEESDAYLQATEKKNNTTASYVGYCDGSKPGTSCLSIHVMNFVHTAGVEYMSYVQAHRVLTHELGHALGLGHNTKPNDVMNATVPDGITPEQGYAYLAADLRQYVGLCLTSN